MSLRLYPEYPEQELKLQLTYVQSDPLRSFQPGATIIPVNNSGIDTGKGIGVFAGAAGTVTDWYDGQTLD